MTSQKSNHAVVVGGGTMGVGIAAIFCAAGWRVDVVDPEDDHRNAIPDAVGMCLEQLEVEKTPQVEGVSNLGLIDWPDVALVVECVPENLDLKRKVFAELEALAMADTPLTSNSSSFPISDIAEGLETQARMAGLHFFMPAHLVPLVEVVSGPRTAPEVAAMLCDTMEALDKRPVHVRKDVPGFLANRMQHALMREAFSLAEQGVASPEDIDAAVQYSFGMRFLGAGLFLQKDLAGLDIHHAAASTIYPDLSKADTPSSVLSNKIATGNLGVKTGEGFFKWTEDEKSLRTARYSASLIEALKVLKEFSD